MRLTFTTLILAAGLATAADGPKPVTYLEGNLDGFSLATETTLEFANARQLVLHTKDAAVEVPYLNVTSTDRVTVPVSVEKEPLYKVWELHKRLVPPAPVEKLTLKFKGKGGDQWVTLETDKETAEAVINRVRRAEEQRAANAGAWWGDSVWKTKRNQDEWGGAGAVAQRE